MQSFNKYNGFVVYRDGADRFIDADIGVEIVMRRNEEGGFACTARRADFKYAERRFGIPAALVESLSEHAIGIAALVLADLHLKSVQKQESDFLRAVFSASEPEFGIQIGSEI